LKSNPRLRQRGEAALLIGDTYLAQRNLQQARETYLAAAQGQYYEEPEVKTRAMVDAAKVEIIQGNLSQAAGRLTEAVKSNPQDKLTNDALDLLEILRASQDDSAAVVYLLQADLELHLGERARADSLHEMIASRSKAAELAQRALWNLAASYRAQGRAGEAIKVLQANLLRFPKSLQAPEVLLQIGEIKQRELGDRPGATEAYEKILIDFPNSMPVQEARKRLRELETVKT
jgi:tetratricopeptide (TPR) repeat protein